MNKIKFIAIAILKMNGSSILKIAGTIDTFPNALALIDLTIAK